MLQYEKEKKKIGEQLYLEVINQSRMTGGEL